MLPTAYFLLPASCSCACSRASRPHGLAIPCPIFLCSFIGGMHDLYEANRPSRCVLRARLVPAFGTGAPLREDKRAVREAFVSKDHPSARLAGRFFVQAGLLFHV